MSHPKSITFSVNIDTLLGNIGKAIDTFVNEYGYKKVIVYVRPYILDAIRAKYDQFIRVESAKPILYGWPIKAMELSGDELAIVKEDFEDQDLIEKRVGQEENK